MNTSFISLLGLDSWLWFLIPPSCKLQTLGCRGDDCSNWVPATNMGVLDCVPGWIQTNPSHCRHLLNELGIGALSVSVSLLTYVCVSLSLK